MKEVNLGLRKENRLYQLNESEYFLITYLSIADYVIEISSDDPMHPLDRTNDWRFKNFVLDSFTGIPDIRLDLQIIKSLPLDKKLEDRFVTYHFQDGAENWRFQERDGQIIFSCPLATKELFSEISPNFNSGTVFVLPMKKGEEEVWQWDLEVILYDFLQVLLINYCALNEATFVHSVGVADLANEGILYPGVSGAGKSTTARLWSHSKQGRILNDDRMIVRKINNIFYLYGTPWHGDFQDYLKSDIKRAPLKRILFLEHADSNFINELSAKEAFLKLYQCFFIAFWDKNIQESVITLAEEMVRKTPTYQFGS